MTVELRPQQSSAIPNSDGGDPANAFDLWPVLESPRGAHVYCCGPRPLMQAVRGLTGHGSSAAVHFEDFGSSSARTKDDVAFRVLLARSNTAIDVPSDTAILEVLRSLGYDVASSCESGTCGTCRTTLLGRHGRSPRPRPRGAREGALHHGVRVARAAAS